jgi:lipid-A-disaccharide synthase
VPALLCELVRLIRYLRAHPPDVLVPIDFGAFNVRLLRGLRGSGIRSVYYIPPGCWSRTRAPGELPWLVDAIATPFPWSAERLRSAGGPARIEWVGHPLLEYSTLATPAAAARERLGISPDRPVVALLPGSRRAEIRYLMEPFWAAVARLTPRPLCLVTVAPNVQGAREFEQVPSGVEVRWLDGLDYSLLPAATAACVASGTATLELTCLGIPMVVAYRGAWATWLQYRLVARGGRIRHVALPNILADAPVVPEFLQEAAHPAALAAALAPLLGESSERRAQLAALTALRAALGDGQTTVRTAELIAAVAGM